MIRILRIEIENFFSIENEVIDLQNPLGLVLVEGQNGAGKSSLVAEPVVWAFKGVTLRGAKGDAVVRQGAKGCRVAVVFESGGVPYTVTRFQKMERNRIVITGVSEDLSARSKVEVQKQLDQLVPLSFEALTALLVLGEGLENRFTVLSARQKHEFLEWLVHESWEDAERRAVSEAALLKARRDSRTASIAALQQRAGFLFSQVMGFAQQKELASVQVRLKLDAVLHRLADLHAEALKASGTPVLPDGMVEVEATAAAGVAEAQGLVAYWQRMSTSIRAVDGQASCPQCMQPVAAAYVVETMRSVQCQIEQCTQRRDEAYGKLNEVRGLLNQQRQLRSAADQRSAEIRLRELEQAQLQTELDRIMASQPAGTDELSRIDADIKQVAAALAVDEEQAPLSEFWAKGYSPTGMRSYRMDGVLAWVNTKLLAYCDRLYDGQIRIQFAPDRVLTDGRVKNELNIEGTFAGGDYTTASRSERRRADLAIHFALQDLASWTTGVQINLLVADEVLDGMDRDSAERVLLLLRERASIGTVFLVTHRDDLRNATPVVWSVSKTEGATAVQRGV